MKQDILTIVETNLHVFTHKVVEAVLQGYMIDENHPPNTWFFAYEVGMVRTDKTAAQLIESAGLVEDGKPAKMGIIERMQKARAARGANKVDLQ